MTSRFPTLTPARRALRLTPPSGAVDVVIDTDATNEIDGEFAVVWSLLRPDRLRVRGLVASPYGYSRELLASGLVLPELDARRLSRRLAAAGVDVARIPTFDPADGMRRAHAELVRILELARDCGVPCDARAHPGADRYLPAPDEPVDSPGVRFLIETAHAMENRPLYVVAIGCATNVASALLLEPSWFSAHTIPTPSLDAELRWVAHGPERHTMLEAIDVDRDEIFADLYGCLEEHSVKTRADPDAPPDAPWDALGPAARPPY